MASRTGHQISVRTPHDLGFWFRSFLCSVLSHLFCWLMVSFLLSPSFSIVVRNNPPVGRLLVTIVEGVSLATRYSKGIFSIHSVPTASFVFLGALNALNAPFLPYIEREKNSSSYSILMHY